MNVIRKSSDARAIFDRARESANDPRHDVGSARTEITNGWYIYWTLLARRLRASSVRALFGDLYDRAARSWRRVCDGLGKRRRQREMIRELHGLSDRMLHDIGIDRSQIEFLVRSGQFERPAETTEILSAIADAGSGPKPHAPASKGRTRKAA